MQCTFLGDHSLLMDFSSSPSPLREVHGISQILFANKPSWASEVIPGLDSLVIQLRYTYQDPKITRETAQNELHQIAVQFQQKKNSGSVVATVHHIQVCYHADLGLDLKAIAASCRLSDQETIHLHKKVIYTADILGFMPGFAYFSGLDPRLSLPRRPSPRPMVPRGSVAIAELQTAIYPRATPGGWSLIGRSPNILFSVNREPPGVFMPGDQMAIEEISLDQFHQLNTENLAIETILPLEPLNHHEAFIEVKQAGALTSIQDEPRVGLSHLAIGPGGASDLASLHLANALVGNPIGMAAIEMTATGPGLLFSQDTCVAWVGATCSGMVNGKSIPGNRPVWIAKGSTLQLAILNPGLRAVLAVSGGLDYPDILGRKGSHLSADIGPKRLKKGDILPLKDRLKAFDSPLLSALHNAIPLPSFPKWHVKSPYLPTQSTAAIYCLPGPHLSLLSKEDRALFWSAIWQVSEQSNRMGIRLKSSFRLKNALPDIPSQAMSFGTIQFPPSQEPIAMLSEHNTTGGYPRLAEVIKADQVKLAQVKPGSTIQLIPIDLATADRLNQESLNLQNSTICSIQTIIQCATGDT